MKQNVNGNKDRKEDAVEPFIIFYVLHISMLHFLNKLHDVCMNVFTN